MSSAACTNIANVCSLPDPPAVRSALVRRGYRVLTPFGTNQRYDLAIDVGDRFLRAQCKTGRLRRGTIIFAVRSVRSNTRRTYLRTYENEVDLFLVYCPETDRVYAIPIEEATSSVGALRVAPTANGQAKGIRWACEYELPE
jgi:PD-(D/E)XK nuclease superfamily protein